VGVIHPTAVIHPQAQVDASVEVGPYAVVDAEVEVGPGCVLGPYVYVTGWTRIGAGNKFYPGCVIGEAPQDLKYCGGRTGLVIGNNNSIREHVTIHRSASETSTTVLGSGNLLMAHCHVGHDSQIGDSVIIANGALLGGHVVLGDRAVVSGNCLVHQFVRVGTLAMMQGGSAISKDLPPYTIARGDNGISGLNTIGLRRAGFSSAERLELRQLYHALFRQGLNLRAALAAAMDRFHSGPAKTMLQFIAASKRGICFDRGGSSVKVEEATAH